MLMQLSSTRIQWHVSLFYLSSLLLWFIFVAIYIYVCISICISWNFFLTSNLIFYFNLQDNLFAFINYFKITNKTKKHQTGKQQTRENIYCIFCCFSLNKHKQHNKQQQLEHQYIDMHIFFFFFGSYLRYLHAGLVGGNNKFPAEK